MKEYIIKLFSKSSFYLFIFLLYILIVFFSKNAYAHQPYNVGYRSLSTWNQKENIRLDISLWYPTYRAPSEFTLNDSIIFAAKDAPIMQIIDEERAVLVRIIRDQISKKAEEDHLTAWERLQELKKAPLPFHPLPLILLSHDTGATRFTNYTIAQALASKGYIVAIPMHEGDNAWQMQLAHSARALTKRAKQISASLDLLLSNASLELYIDRNNLTYLGFGSAGTAGLLLTKATLNPEGWINYCLDNAFLNENHTQTLSPIETLIRPTIQNNLEISHDFESKNVFENQEKRINPYCVSPIKEIMDELSIDLEVFSEYNKMTNSYYDNISEARKNIATENREHLISYTALLKRQNPSFKNFIQTPPFIQPYFPLFEKTVSLQDGRFNRMIFVSPGYSMLFNKQDLSEIEIPMLFIGLDADNMNVPEYQSEVFVKYINTLPNIESQLILKDEENKIDAYILLHEEIDDATKSMIRQTETYQHEKSTQKKNAQHVILYNTDIWGLQAPCAKEHALVEICNTVSEDVRADVTKQVCDIIEDFVPQVEE